MQNILTRRSIRKYTSQPISEETIEDILKAAMAAPSAGNQQPWHFIVVRDRQTLDEIPRIHANARTAEAPVAILVCADMNLVTHSGMWDQDCSAATQNILLAAHALGFGAVWCGIHPRPERIAGLRQLFGLPNNIVPFSVVPIGYPAESKTPSERYQESRVHREGW